MPSSQSRRYDKMRRFPAGLLVLGDAICSFNPIYGQGMTVAALEALALQRCLRRGEDGLARRYSSATTKAVGVAWQLAAGADLSLPEVEGPRPLPVRIANKYVDRVLAAAESDTVVAEQFAKVIGLIDPPTACSTPRSSPASPRATCAGGKAITPPQKPQRLGDAQDIWEGEGPMTRETSMTTGAALDMMALDKALDELRTGAPSWVALPLGDKVALLDTLPAKILDLAPQMVAASGHAKGIASSSAWVAEDWVTGVWPFIQGVTAHALALKRVLAGQEPIKANTVHTRPDGQVVVDVFPVTGLDRLLLNGYKAQVWIEAGISAAQTRKDAAKMTAAPATTTRESASS